MRAVALLLLVAGVVGCGGKVDPSSPGASPQAKGGQLQGKKLTLQQAQELILGEGGLNRAGVKKLLGPPSQTTETRFGPSDLVAEMWTYNSQTVIWDAAAEKYYSTVRVTFLRLAEGQDTPATAVAAD